MENINFGPNTKKYQDPIVRISGYKLLNCFADQYSKPYKTQSVKMLFTNF